MNRRYPENFQDRIQREQYRAESEAIAARNAYNPNQPYLNERFEGRPMTGSSNDYGVGREWIRSDYSRPYGASQPNEYAGPHAPTQGNFGYPSQGYAQHGQYDPQFSQYAQREGAYGQQGQFGQRFGQQTQDMASGYGSQYGSSGYGGNYGAGQYGQPQYGQPLSHGGSGYSHHAGQQYGSQPQGFRGGYPESSFGYGGAQPQGQYSSGRYDPQLAGQRTGDFTGRGPKNYSRSNERVREDICERLTADPYIDAQELEVRCENGTVVIEGQVEERWMKHRIEDLVDATAGVKQIDNRVTVAGQRQGSSSTLRSSETQPVSGTAGNETPVTPKAGSRH